MSQLIANPVVELMRRHGIPVTRENYTRLRLLRRSAGRLDGRGRRRSTARTTGLGPAAISRAAYKPTARLITGRFCRVDRVRLILAELNDVVGRHVKPFPGYNAVVMGMDQRKAAEVVDCHAPLA
jgi:hypothetical protein